MTRTPRHPRSSSPDAAPGARDGSARPAGRLASRRAWAVAVLVALTAAGGLAARPGPGAGPGAAPTDLPLAFTAPGAGPVHFAGRLDRGAVLRGGDGRVRMELVVRGDAAAGGRAIRVPTDLVVVFDRSGSMAGEPLRFARAAVHELVAGLGPQDRFALVSYAGGARTDVPLATVTAERRGAVEAAIDRLVARGGTNMSAGIELANATVAGARRTGAAPRIVLISDGHANQGDATPSGLVARARRAVAGEWVLSAVGVGPDFDESLMGALADAGTGNFTYLRDASALGGVFEAEFAAARETLASGLAVRLEPAPGVEVVDAAGYPLERAGRVVRFRPGALFAGQERRLWVTFRVPVGADPVTTDVAAGGEASLPLGAVALEFELHGEPGRLAFPAAPRVALVGDRAAYLASVDADAWQQGVLGDELGSLKDRVARALREGKRERALGAIDDYVSRNASLGRALGSPAAVDRVEEVRALAGEVEKAFEPDPAAPARRNALSKQLTAEGRDDRRVGSRKD